MPLLTIVALVLQVQTVAAQAVEVDPALRGTVERFFAMQQAEDASGYLALWSARAKRPDPEQLKYVFESGDDTFSGLTIVSARTTADTARVRVAVTRTRVANGPDGKPRTFRSPVQFALTLVREGSEWKLIREGAPVDELAAALIDAGSEDARRELLQADKDLLTSRLVEAMWRRADPLAQQQQYAAAQAIYERSLDVARAIGDRKAEGQALQNVANSLYFQRQFDRALELYEERLELERAIENDEGISNALLGIATVRYSSYEYGLALEKYREALAIQERLDDLVLVSTTLISTGNVLYLQGDYEGAIRDYRRAEEIKRKYFDLVGAAQALEGLARVYTAQGDYASALTAYAGVLDERRKRNDGPRQALALQSIGDIHFRLGNLDQARTAFAESRGHFEQAKDLSGAGRVLQGTAITELVAGNLRAGEQAYADGIRACTTADDAECVARAQAGLGFALSAQQKFDEALPWYGKAIDGFIILAQDEAVARARIGLAEALTGKGDPQAALREAAEARRTAVGLAKDDILWRALVSQARAERKLGRGADALGTARAAVLSVRRLAADALERPQHPVSRDTTAAYAMAAVLHAEAGDAASAFDTAEELRAHALRLWLAPHEREIARGMTGEERAEERRLSMELTALLVRREREGSLAKPDQKRLARLDESIAQAVAARNAARTRLFERLPELATWRGLAPAATTADLDALLTDPGTVVIGLIVDEHDVVITTAVKPKADEAPRLIARAIPVERRALGERVARALDAKSLADEAAWRKAAGEIFSIVPPEIAAQLAAAGRVVVIPDDLLWRVPFEAMPLDREYLGERAIVSSLSSITAALRSGERAPAEASQSIAIVTAPELPAAVVEELKRTAPSWALRPGEAATAEGRAVANVFADDTPAVMITGSAATTDAMAAAIESSSMLHVSAPFRVNSASPLFSPMLLSAKEAAGEAAPASGARVELRELFDLRAAVATVTMTDAAALSMREAAAAVAPVEWAWRVAGASTVVLRRWGGREEHASALLGRFYRELRDGRTPAQALHAAREAVRARPGGRAPAAWAGWLVLSAR